MNYNELKQNYPKAFDQFVNWYRKYFDLSMFSGFAKVGLGLLEQIIANDDSNLTRDLYEFFDGNGIYISVEIQRNIVSHKIYFLYFLREGEVDMRDDYMVGLIQYSSRTEAEEAAFLTAFEILEQQLNNNKL
jgi:hypothetical protein